MNGGTWLFAKICVSVTLLAVLVSQADLREVVKSAGSTNPAAVLVAFLVALVSWAVNTLKWQRLLEALQYRLRYSCLFGLNLIGLFYSLVLPGQISGEVVKGIKLGGRGVPSGVVAATIAADRIGGVAAICIWVVVGLLLSADSRLRLPLLVAATALLALLCSLLLLLKMEGSGGSSAALARAPGVLVKILEPLVSTLRTFSALRERRIIIIATLLSLLSQLLVTLSNYAVALGTGVEIPFVAMLWIVSAVSLVHLVPVTFAGLGVREGAYVFLLHEHGISVPLALTVSLTVFAVILSQGLLGGALEILGHRNAAKTPAEQA